jgi:predicted DNA binding CopG/RHH family protein
MKKHSLKALPSLTSDDEAEKFIDTSDLSEYDLSQFVTVKFEFEPKTAVLNMRLPENLLTAVKIKAKAEGLPYTRFIRLVLEQAVT